MGGSRVPIALAALALLASSCQMELGVGAQLRRDGSGVFTLAIAADKEFVDGLAQGLNGVAPEGGFEGFKDFFRSLESRGWSVQQTRTPQGDEAIAGRCSFRSSADFGRCLSDLSSAEGGRQGVTLRDTGMSFDLGTKRGVFKTRAYFAGSVNLEGPAEMRSPQMVEQLQTIAGKVFMFDVRVEMPGSPRVVRGASAATVNGSLVTWRPKIGERLDFRAESDAWNATPIAAVTLPALLLVGLALWLLMRRRPAPAPDGFVDADPARQEPGA